MQHSFAQEKTDARDRISRAQGRKARRYSASAKLTYDEHQQVERAAKSEGKALSEWCRECLLSAAKGEVVTPLFTEIVAIRQMLNSTLRSLACGERMTAEAFQKELQTIRSSKHKAAAEVMQQYADTGDSR